MQEILNSIIKCFYKSISDRNSDSLKIIENFFYKNYKKIKFYFFFSIINIYRYFLKTFKIKTRINYQSY